MMSWSTASVLRHVLMSVRRRCESISNLHLTSSGTGSGGNGRSLTHLPAVIYGHIQSYFETDVISSLVLVNKSMNRLVINYIKTHLFDIEFETILVSDLPVNSSDQSTSSKPPRDLLDKASASALTIIQHHCNGTVRRLILPWRSSWNQFAAKLGLVTNNGDVVASAITRIDAFVMTIIKQNHQSIMEVVHWGSHTSPLHLTLMSTCPRLMKWEAPDTDYFHQCMIDLKQLYQMCPMLSHLLLTGTENSTDLKWMKGD
jgi:hypothetical protein